MFPGGIGTPELIVFGIIALLLFGKRLPEVARNLGKGLTEFKKGMKGFEDEVRGAARSTDSYKSTPPRRPEPTHDDEQELTAPKFEPPRFEPASTSNTTEN
jgi:sec-independent protein translocase protein TatA